MTVPTGVAAVVLLAVLVVGVAVGRSRRRFGLLVVGIIAIAVIGFLVTAAATSGPVSTRAADIARLYTTAVPPLVAFVAGWLCARGSWFTRIVVIAAAALLLAAFPYANAGDATAKLLPQASVLR